MLLVDQVIKGIPPYKEPEISLLPLQQHAIGVHSEPDEFFFTLFHAIYLKTIIM
jgi:hypothetical protein